MPKAESETNFISTLFRYFSQSIIPILIPLFFAALFFVWSAKSEVSHAQKDIDRIAHEHNSRIMANQISIRDVDNKVARIETSVTQILQSIDTTQKDIRTMKQSVSKINGSILVLLDRDERRNAEQIKAAK